MSTRRKILYGFIAFVLLALGLTAPGLIAARKYKKALDAVFHDYSTSLVTHDYARAFAHGGEGFKGATPFSVFADEQRNLEFRYGKLESAKESGTFVHGKGSPMKWTAVVEGTYKYEKADVRFIYEFHFEDGEWRLFGYRQP